MNKKLFNLSLITLGLLSISSCGKNSLKPSKGNSVNSITFDYYKINYLTEEREKKTATINKNDSYTDMMNKIEGLNFNNISYKNESCINPFYETYSEKLHATIKNNVIRQIVTKYGDVINKGGEPTLVDETFNNNKTASTKFYSYSYEDGFFYTGSRNYDEKSEYKLPDETTKVGHETKYTNKGIYFNDKFYRGNEGGMVEIAANISPLPVSNLGDTEFSETDSFYFKTEFAAKDRDKEGRKSYKNEDLQISFSVNNILHYGDIHTTTPTTENDKESSDGFYKNPKIVKYTENIDDYLKDYYNLSFELTDKYLIIKNKLNTCTSAIEAAKEYKYYGNEDKIDELLSSYNGSYEYQEIWIDYKNTIVTDNSFRIGYVYYKHDIIEKYNYSYPWSEVDNYNYSKELLESIGAYDKTYNKNHTYEIHWETSLMNISDKEITKKKNDFIDKCKKNNIVDKYNIQATE